MKLDVNLPKKKVSAKFRSLVILLVCKSNPASNYTYETGREFL